MLILSAVSYSHASRCSRFMFLAMVYIALRSERLVKNKYQLCRLQGSFYTRAYVIPMALPSDLNHVLETEEASERTLVLRAVAASKFISRHFLWLLYDIINLLNPLSSVQTISSDNLSLPNS